jgi:transcription initiation factor TFIIIB Brf1 subunit/transcription initiation factor TFIIB
MWGSRNRGNDRVVCVACGLSVERSAAREYDKEGDRWSRRGKEFEYVCKSCHRDLCHQPRNELEELLVEIESNASLSREEFLRRYSEAVEERYGSLESK